MEKWGNLPQGSVDIAKKSEAREFTRSYLIQFAEEVAKEVEQERALKETQLDLDKLRWPVSLSINKMNGEIILDLMAVIDRMGRYYFRVQDVNKDWFVPGYKVERISTNSVSSNPSKAFVSETILEVTPLFIGEQEVAIQVSTSKDS